MNLEIAPRALKKYQKLRKNNPSLSKLLDKTIAQFTRDKAHPSLRLHKLENQQGEVWSISASTKLRIIILQEGQNLTIIDLGSHDQVY